MRIQSEEKALRLGGTLLEEDDLNVGFGGERGQEDSKVVDEFPVESGDLRR